MREREREREMYIHYTLHVVGLQCTCTCKLPAMTLLVWVLSKLCGVLGCALKLQ